MSRHRRLHENRLQIEESILRHSFIKGEIETRSIGHAPAIYVHTYRALIRVVGFFFYNNRGGRTLLRGQTGCYRTLKPQAYRIPPGGTSAKMTAAQRSAVDSHMNGFVTAFRAATGADPLPGQQLTTEPLLQHYGLRTRWLDFVDSVPHALFFALNEFVHGSRWLGGQRLSTYVPSAKETGCMYVCRFEESDYARLPDGTTVDGVWTGRGGELLADLRRSKPSIALRPHAQHGLLVRPAPGADDLWDSVEARVIFNTANARRWIAGAEALEREAMFPSRPWDGVLGQLLSANAVAAIKSHSGGQIDLGDITEYDFAPFSR